VTSLDYQWSFSSIFEAGCITIKILADLLNMKRILRLIGLSFLKLSGAGTISLLQAAAKTGNVFEREP
jgi:hypothetical protein